jgi:tyrosine-protein phosphatase YwqE
MIDLHGHYLPGVDDGAGSLEDSLAMLSHAEADGIEAVVVTPHANSAQCTVKGFDHVGTAAHPQGPSRPADHQQRLLLPP